MASGHIEDSHFVSPISTFNELISLVSGKPQEVFCFGLVYGSEINVAFCKKSSYAFCVARWNANTIIDCLVLCEWRDFVVRFNPTTGEVTDCRPYLDSVDSFVSKSYSCVTENYPSQTFISNGVLTVPWGTYLMPVGDISTGNCFFQEEYISSITRMATGASAMPISACEAPQCVANGTAYRVNNKGIVGRHYDGSTTYTTSPTSRVSTCFLRKDYVVGYGHD